MKLRKILCVALIALLTVSALAGCGGEKEELATGSLTLWMGARGPGGQDNFGQLEGMMKIQENLGITVEFVHPSSAAWEESFNIMIASGDYTDIIHWNWGSKYNGGYEGALNDGVIVDLTDKMDKLPTYSKVLAENPDVDRSIRTVDGKLLYFASVKEDTSVNACYGPMIRKDWLDKLNLEMPTTIDEWYTVLKAFKTQDPNGNGKADEIPFADYKAAAFKQFAGAFGTRSGIYVKNGKVVYGFMQPEYKAFVTEMNKWYKEGLLDSEYPALEKATQDAYMTNGTSGACIAYVGSGMGTYLTAGQADPNYNLVAAPWPSKEAGAPNYIPMDFTRRTSTDTGSVITTKCANLDVAFRFMDYLYSEEGTILQNWGIEGKSYVIENGEYKLTDFVTNNPDGKSRLQALGLYADVAHDYPAKIVDAEAYAAAQYGTPQQKDASIVWDEGDTRLMTLEWPLTADEKAKLTEIQGIIKTYESEVVTKMVIGTEPISNYGKHMTELRNRGLDEMLSIYQAAYDRFMAN
ncbi:MAG: extracellular solute-binding protein [Clostridia bacterium]|nr:extracellular solute-binding protein [Clostridia bacterium]